MENRRPSRTQEIIRQWILFIPLATAVVGSLLVQKVSENYQEILLPSMFYVGALIVTSAMLHQRQLLSSNQELNEQLQAANEQLDEMHHLALTLSQSLDMDEIVHATLAHTRRMLNVDACALWLRCDFLPPEVQRHYLQELIGEEDTPERWLPLASLGMDGNELSLLEGWGHLLNQGKWNHEEQHFNVQGRSNSQLLPTLLNRSASAICTPIVMKGDVAGVLLVKRARPLRLEHTSSLQSIALISAQALHNSLHYQAASLRAELDGLTNLFNHRATQERLAQEVSRVGRKKTQHADAALAVATMDVNDFKIFNDTYGHATGDRVLRTISDTLRATFRSSDVVGRFGGDEFVMILPDTNRAGAETLCDRAVQAVAAQNFEATDGSKIQLRLTCGVAAFPGDGESAADLLRVSDARLYVAKRRGVQIVEGEAAQSQLIRPRWQDVGVLEALVTAIDNKDRYTRAYCEKVWRYALLIARQMNLQEETVQAVGVCSLVHDVGKIIVPDSILRKPGRLTPEEMQVMQQHTNFGAIIVRDVPHLDLVLGGVRHHHENYDGSGYPDRLSGEKIPLLGRLLAVPVSFAAMITDRPYRKALSVNTALDEIEVAAGQRFDPVMVQAFMQVMKSEDSNDSQIADILQMVARTEAVEAL